MRYLVPFVLLLGCGDDGSPAHPDATDTDAPPAIDASEAGPVTVIASTSTGPRFDAEVIFLDASGALVAVERTDSTGTAKHDMLPGGSVTIVDRTRHELHTITGVVPGDILRDGHAPAPAKTQLQISWPAVTQKYRVSTNCGGQESTTNTITLDVCGFPTHVFVEAIDTNGVAQMAMYDATVAAASAHVMSDTTWDTTNLEAAVSIVANNIPADITSLSAGIDLYSPYGYVVGRSATLSPANRTASFASTLPTSLVGHIAASRVSFSRPPFSSQFLLAHTMYDGTGVTMDVGAHVMPWVTGGSWSATTRTLTWTEGGGGQAPSHVYIDLGYVDAFGISWSWILVGAHGATASQQFPTLPAELADIDFHGSVAGTLELIKDSRSPAVVRSLAHSNQGLDGETAATIDASYTLFPTL